MLKVSYRLDKDIDPEGWLGLFHASGWNQEWTLRNAETMLRHAWLVVTAWVGDEIVGTLTILSDGVNYATLDDVVVHPARRRQGIGSRLVLLAIEQTGHVGPHLEAVPGVASFYERLGFVVNQGHTPMYWPLVRESPRRVTSSGHR